MRIGKMDREIVIEQPVPFQNSTGESEDVWEEYLPCWADVRSMRADERFVSDGTHSVRVSNFRIRYDEGVSPTMRIKYEGLVWKITGLAEVGRREGLDITAEAIL